MTKTAVEKGLFGYPAEKHVMSKALAEMIPEHKVYVEPFVGSGAVLFAKEKSAKTVVNDADPEVGAFWQAIVSLPGDKLEKLVKMNWEPDKKTFEKLKASSPTDPVAIAYRFLFLARYSHNSARRSFATNGRGNPERMPGLVRKFSEQLYGIKAFSGDYEKICRKYDGPDTFFFFDPPYAGYDNGVGEKTFDEQRLFKLLKSLQGKWLLTYGARGALPKMLRESKFTVKSWSITRAVRNNPGDSGKAKLDQVYASNYGAVKKSALVGETWPSLLVPDPEHLIKRLDGEQVAGVLTCKDHTAQAGPLALVNYDQRLAQSWGVVELRKGVRFPSGERAVEALGDKVCPTTARVFKSIAGDVFFHPLDLVEPWVPQAVNHPQKAVWTRAEINDLSDSAFLYVEPDGEKDDDGKTVPRTLRHLPIRDADGKLDLPHLRNAIARIPQAQIPGLSAEDLAGLQAKARRLLEEHKEQTEKAEAKDLSDLSDEDLVKLLHVLGQEYHRAQSEGGDEEAINEVREAKWAVVAEMRRRGLPPPGWAQQKSVNVAKSLSAKEEAEYQAENKSIAESKKTPLAQQPHPFRAAKFTNPIGHPRCLLCGGEERVSGWCNDPERDAVAAKKAEGFNPLAEVRPQQAKGEYADADEALTAFASDQALQDGVAVEPLMPGPVVVVHRAVKGSEPTVRVDGASDDQCKAVKEALEKLDSSAVLVGALADDKVHVTDMLYWDAEALGQQPWHQRAAKRQEVFGREKGAIGNVVGRVVHSADALKAAVKWALSAPGSAGAMLKLASATYDQGGCDNEAVIKVAQVVNVIVYAKTESGELRCALGPVTEREADDWADTAELEGRAYVPVGSVEANGIEAEPGDVVRVHVSGFETVDTPGKRAITWSTPDTQERVHVKPSTVADVRSNSTPQKFRKQGQVHGSVRRPVQILKADDELRFVLGVVLEPNDGDGEAPLDPDAHKDIYSETTLREACHLYQMEHGRTGVKHQRELSSQEARICENYIMPCDGEVGGQKVRKGTWMLGARILSDQVWQQVKRGELNAWSIDGEALRTPEEE